MAATCLLEDLEAYVNQYNTHGAIQRLQFIISKTEKASLKVEACRLCLDLLKRTTNTRSYSEVHKTLKDVLESESEGAPAAVPPYDSVWVEATQKQATIMQGVHDQDLHQAKVQQMKEPIRTAHAQLASFCTDQGDYPNALKYISKSREYCSESSTVFQTCMQVIKLSALLRQYPEIQSFTSKAHHTPYKEEADQSKIFASYGIYYMATGKYKDAALSFVQAKVQHLTPGFTDVLSGQDVAVYGTLCALASLDRTEVRTKLLDSVIFRENLDLHPVVRDLACDFCNCRYGTCLAALEKWKEPLSLDVHLSEQISDMFQQIRSRGMVQYFSPFMSVSLRSMAKAFNTDVDGIQTEVAQLIKSKQLDGKIDSHNKVLHVRHAKQRTATYQNAMRVSQDFIDTTQALVLRMNLLKHDFGVHLIRTKK
jgi:COP9 signalosome complex subunit 1